MQSNIQGWTSFLTAPGVRKWKFVYPDRLNSSRTYYHTDLTDAEWEQLAPLVPVVKPCGRPPKRHRREILKAPSMWCAAAMPVNGCPMTFRPGARSIITSGLGTAPESGRRFMTGCENKCRRQQVDTRYERWPQTTESLIYIAMIRLMTRRLAAP